MCQYKAEASFKHLALEAVKHQQKASHLYTN